MVGVLANRFSVTATMNESIDWGINDYSTQICHSWIPLSPPTSKLLPQFIISLHLSITCRRQLPIFSAAYQSRSHLLVTAYRKLRTHCCHLGGLVKINCKVKIYTTSSQCRGKSKQILFRHRTDFCSSHYLLSYVRVKRGDGSRPSLSGAWTALHPPNDAHAEVP